MTPAQQSWRDVQRAQGEARAELVRPLAAEHMTAEQIGSYLHMTKGQVVGLCHRHDIKLGSPERRAAREHCHRARVATATASFAGVPLRDRGCRWPAWGNEAPTHLYCGADKDLMCPYCDGHMAVAYRAKVVPAIG